MNTEVRTAHGAASVAAGAVASDRAAAADRSASGQTRIVTVSVPDITNFILGHTGGDTDFGHGPTVHVSVEVQRHTNRLVLAVSAFFQEIEPYWTTFEGTQNQSFYDITVEHPGWLILALQGGFHQVFQTTLMGFGQHAQQLGSDGSSTRSRSSAMRMAAPSAAITSPESCSSPSTTSRSRSPDSMRQRGSLPDGRARSRPYRSIGPPHRGSRGIAHST